MPYRTLTLERRGHVAWIRLARPDRGNPIDRAFLQELEDACDAINDDRDVRVAVLTGAGEVFSRGWDPPPGAETLAELTALRREWTVVQPFSGLDRMGQPVIAAINGDATGAGLELALACDIRLAAREARFSLPETSFGLIPMAGGTQRLPRLVDRGTAMEMILAGAVLDAAEAQRVGLVTHTAPRARLDALAEGIAEMVASRGPVAVRYARESVRRGLDMPLTEALRFETDLTVILQTTEDRAEGVRAFIDKRRPRFRGR